MSHKKFPVLTFLVKLRDFCSSSLLSRVLPVSYVAKSSDQVEFSDLYKRILGPLVGGSPMAAHTIKSEQQKILLSADFLVFPLPRSKLSSSESGGGGIWSGSWART